MNCDSLDLKAYALKEASAAERRAVEQHAAGCRPCAEELERLALTFTALAALPQEEIPRRIAFVSDKVFEPRWYRRLWNSPARLGFASAALLSGAIFTHALTRPVPVVITQAPPTAVSGPAVPVAAAPAPVDLDAIRKLLAESEARQARLTADRIATSEQRADQNLRETKAAIDVSFEGIGRQINVLRRGIQTASVGLGGSQ